PAKKDVMSVKRVSGVPSVSGRLVSQDKLIDLNTTPVVSWTEAIDRALAVYNRGRRSKDTSIANGGNCAVKVQLTVLDPTILGLKADRARLAWHILVDGIVVFIDAQDGTKIFQYNDMLSAFDHIRIYDVDGGGQDQCETATPVLDENGPYPGAPSVSADSDDNAGKAQAEAKKAHDFFKKLGWKSYDEQASVINFCVRVQQGNWDSRFGQYSPTLHCVYLYPGLALAQDIAFHEFTHGVIQFMPALKPSSTWPSGGLERRDEAGALGEALADFFGAQIEGLNWTIGEHIPDDPFFYPQELGPGKNGKPLRNMADPHKGTYTQNEECPDPSPAGFYPNCPNRGWNNGQPDHYGELVTAEQQLCAWKEPGNGCIHINSGIFNKAMFLAANGGDHHNVHVEGIGSGKLVRIIFRALRNKAITPNINMKEFARKSHEACTDLMEKSVIRNPVFTRLNIVKANCDQIQNAFAAVGLMKPHN
ncbi:MAG TPA: M4 family metallopeptidase, partial [Nitrospira sp.]|nr:M4 family metallopeptidase [Nitrospira sp.]